MGYPYVYIFILPALCWLNDLLPKKLEPEEEEGLKCTRASSVCRLAGNDHDGLR